MSIITDIQIANLSDDQLLNLERKIASAKESRKTTSYNVKLKTPEVVALKAAIKELESTLETLPKEIDLEKSVMIKLKVGLDVQYLDDLFFLDGEEMCSLRFEIVDEGISKHLREFLEQVIENLDYVGIDANAINEIAGKTKWDSFFSKLKEVKAKLEELELEHEEVLES